MIIGVESSNAVVNPRDKRTTGKIDVPNDIFKHYQEKGSSREKLFELFIKTGGEKDWVVFTRVSKQRGTMHSKCYNRILKSCFGSVQPA